MDALIAMMAAFSMVFLKGLQSQNVIHGHYYAAVVVSLLLAVAEVGLISTVALAGWASLPPVALGGCVGILGAMVFHRRFIRRGT